MFTCFAASSELQIKQIGLFASRHAPLLRYSRVPLTHVSFSRADGLFTHVNRFSLQLFFFTTRLLLANIEGKYKHFF